MFISIYYPFIATKITPVLPKTEEGLTQLLEGAVPKILPATTKVSGSSRAIDEGDP